jgi:uncharacterized BrkB/YihY/UPF0761 family membrane protein
MKRTELTKKTARNKGLVALSAAITTMLFAYLSLIFLIIGIPITAAFTYKWLRYRAEWGLRF